MPQKERQTPMLGIRNKKKIKQRKKSFHNLLDQQKILTQENVDLNSKVKEQQEYQEEKEVREKLLGQVKRPREMLKYNRH